MNLLDAGIRGGTSLQNYAPATQAASGAGSMMPFVEPVTGTIGLLLNAYGMWKQNEENKKAQRLAAQYRKEDIARDESRYQESIKMARQQTAYQKQQAAKNWKWMEDDKRWGRSQQMAGHFLGMLGQQPALQEQLMRIWPSRRNY